MLFHKIEKLYGIDYQTYACGGMGNIKLFPTGSNRVLFVTEEDMLKQLSYLKKQNTCSHFELFTTKIIKEEYKL